jgi:hypothetical protein
MLRLFEVYGESIADPREQPVLESISSHAEPDLICASAAGQEA